MAADLRKVVEGDPSPSGKGALKIARGIEVGHIFQLGDKYSRPMKAAVLDEAGQEMTLLMGCYGIGVTRIVAAAIEQNHDERGIIWPAPIAPFQVVLVPLNLHKSARVREVSDRLYEELTDAGIEVLYDDRDARPGVKFADAELLGIPHRVVVGERGLEAGRLEYRGRRDSSQHRVPRRRAHSRSCARASAAERPRRMARLRRLLVLLVLRAVAHRAHADQQRDPELQAVVEKAIAQAQCFTDQYDSAVWYTLMEPRLRTAGRRRRTSVSTSSSRCIARLIAAVKHGCRRGSSWPSSTVESRFDRWAVSSAGAVGLMQVMPFWPERLGMRRYELVHVAPNIRMGCAILRFYLGYEHNDVRKALARYNGSVGRRDYPDLVITRGRAGPARTTWRLPQGGRHRTAPRRAPGR